MDSQGLSHPHPYNAPPFIPTAVQPPFPAPINVPPTPRSALPARISLSCLWGRLRMSPAARAAHALPTTSHPRLALSSACKCRSSAPRSLRWILFAVLGSSPAAKPVPRCGDAEAGGDPHPGAWHRTGAAAAPPRRRKPDLAPRCCSPGGLHRKGGSIRARFQEHPSPAGSRRAKKESLCCCSPLPSALPAGEQHGRSFTRPRQIKAS